MSTSSVFSSGDIVVLNEKTCGTAAKRVDYVVISGPAGPSKYYQVRDENGERDYFPEKDLVIKPTQADRLTPVTWADCAWKPQEFRA